MRGGDKAPVARKAEAKARRYAPFIKNVDDSVLRAAECLTGFGGKLEPESGAQSIKCRTKYWDSLNLTATSMDLSKREGVFDLRS